MSYSMTFTKTSQGEGSRQYGLLQWVDEKYKCITGGYGIGPIPNGWFDIRVRYAAVGNADTMEAGFINPLSKQDPKEGWFLPIVPKFSIARDGFGIHPDGNLPGTKGCIGLLGEDIQKFWDRWNRASFGIRPTSLQVLSNI